MTFPRTITALMGALILSTGLASYAASGEMVINVDGGVPQSETSTGGAPEANGGVPCNLLIGADVARGENEVLQSVEVAIPVAQGFTLDLYFPEERLPEDEIKVGGSVAAVHYCDTPLGKMIRYVVSFNDDGKANIFLPRVSDNEDGFQLLLVDGDSAFHAAAYVGQDYVMFN